MIKWLKLNMIWNGKIVLIFLLILCFNCCSDFKTNREEQIIIKPSVANCNIIPKLENVSTNQVVIGNGSNEILELAARAFLNKDTSALMSKHAFAVYKIISQACGSRIIEVPMIDWKHDLKSFKDHMNDDTRIVFVANPNNPTGTFNSHKDFTDMMLNIPSSTLVVLDLAYFEYVEASTYSK